MTEALGRLTSPAATSPKDQGAQGPSGDPSGQALMALPGSNVAQSPEPSPGPRRSGRSGPSQPPVRSHSLSPSLCHLFLQTGPHDFTSPSPPAPSSSPSHLCCRDPNLLLKPQHFPRASPPRPVAPTGTRAPHTDSCSPLPFLNFATAPATSAWCGTEREPARLLIQLSDAGQRGPEPQSQGCTAHPQHLLDGQILKLSCQRGDQGAARGDLKAPGSSVS